MKREFNPIDDFYFNNLWFTMSCAGICGIIFLTIVVVGNTGYHQGIEKSQENAAKAGYGKYEFGPDGKPTFIWGKTNSIWNK